MYNKEGPSTTRKQLHKNNTNHASKGVQEELSKFVHKLDISPPPAVTTPVQSVVIYACAM